MNRREFITGAAAVAASAVLPPVGDGVALQSMAHPEAPLRLIGVLLNPDMLVMWPEDQVRAARAGERIIGVAVGRSDLFFPGDPVTMRDGFLDGESIETIEIDLPER